MARLQKSNSERGWAGVHWPRLTLLAVYVILTSIVTLRHPMWRDEIQAWLVARDSPNLTSLFHNLRYEGHPALYYLLLMPLTRISRDPVLIQVLNLAISGATVALVIFRAPLSRVELLLFPFGYFIFYEYAVKSRSYALGCLLVLAFCAYWPLRNRHPVLLGVILAALANVHVLLLIMSVAGVCALVVQRLGESRQPPRRAEVIAGLIVLSGWVAAVLTVRPPPDSGYLTGWFLHPSVDRLHTIADLMGAYFTPRLSDLFSVPAILIVLLVAWRARRNPAAAVFLLVSTLGILAFSYVKQPGSPWHRGLLFVAFIAAVWIDRLDPASAPPPAVPRVKARPLVPAFLVVVVLLVQVRAGVKAALLDLHQPLSNGRAVAAFINARGWAGEPIIGVPDYAVATVVGYLQVDHAFYANGQRWGSFTHWDQQRLATVDMDSTLATAIGFGPAETLISATDENIDPVTLHKYAFVEVAAFTGAQTPDENFVVYRRG